MNSDPVKILLEEHKILLQAIEATRQLQKTDDDKAFHSTMHNVILFFRNFSETYHHPKEETIFYPLLRNRSANVSPEFLHDICDNHEDFKVLVGEIENAFVYYDYPRLRELVNQYLHLFEEHIKRENKIILSVANQLLFPEEKEAAAIAFNELDEKHGEKQNLINDFNKIKLNIA